MVEEARVMRRYGDNHTKNRQSGRPQMIRHGKLEPDNGNSQFDM